MSVSESDFHSLQTLTRLCFKGRSGLNTINWKPRVWESLGGQSIINDENWQGVFWKSVRSWNQMHEADRSISSNYISLLVDILSINADVHLFHPVFSR